MVHSSILCFFVYTYGGKSFHFSSTTKTIQTFLYAPLQALARLGLIDWIGKQTEYVVMSVAPESRLTAAIVLILWISAIASAFVDNLPLTTMMVRIAVDLSSNSDLHLPLQPLIWSLAFGACLGGK